MTTTATTRKIREQVQAGIDARTDQHDLRLVPASPWMTELEVAAYTGFTRSALASMRYEQRGPVFSKPGNRIRYRREDVDAWMAEGRQAPAKRRRSA